MLARLVVSAFCVLAPAMVFGRSYDFRTHASGHLGVSVRFEFRDYSDRHVKADISQFVVLIRTRDQQWQPVWSIESDKRVAQLIEYGVTPPGFGTNTPPKKLVSGRVYGASASDGHGGSSMVVFRFDHTGKMTFPDSLD